MDCCVVIVGWYCGGVQECEADREKAQREAQLMAVRLAAISEVLTLQEKALMQVCTAYSMLHHALESFPS